MSGNTFGAELYSDGKMIAPMMPTFPDLTKCKKCDTLAWLSDMKEIGTLDGSHPEWRNADRVEFLEVADLARFLDMDSVKTNAVKERIVRQHIWWAFNDRVRNDKRNILYHDAESALWKENCRRLAEVLDPTDTHQRIMKAELFRTFGQFDECMKLLNAITDEKYRWVIEKYQTECDKENNLLFMLR